MNKRVYLSGPISGRDYSERKAFFYSVQKALEEKGYEVFNPRENGLPQSSSTADHMRTDIRALLDCDQIYMMRRWNHSAGCQTELLVALSIGLKVSFEFKENVTAKDGKIIYNLTFE